MLFRVTVYIIRRSMCNNARTLCRSQRNSLQLESLQLLCNNSANLHNVQNHCNLYITKRFKSIRKKAADIKKDKDEDSDEENEKGDEENAPVGSKIMKVKISSVRFDTVSKTGFGMSRNKIEEAFYGSRFRINGNKVIKKSKEVEIGDEIDLILHQSVDNPKLLVINRIVILSMDPINDRIQIKLSIDKNLLIEDYEDPYI